MIVINPLVNWILSFRFWSFFFICLLEWIFNVITARLFLIAWCRGWLKCSVSSISSFLLITANITVSSFPPPLLHELCGLGDRRVSVQGVWFFSHRVSFKFYSFHLRVSAIKSRDCGVAFLAVLKILKLYFLLILITCPLPCSKLARHWCCWNTLWCIRICSNSLWVWGSSLEMCWECSPSAAPHAVPALGSCHSLGTLVHWGTQCTKMFFSCAVSGQRCSPPAGEVLGESRDYDLESFLTEVMGAHINAVVFNKRLRQCLTNPDNGGTGIRDSSLESECHFIYFLTLGFPCSSWVLANPPCLLPWDFVLKDLNSS